MAILRRRGTESVRIGADGSKKVLLESSKSGATSLELLRIASERMDVAVVQREWPMTKQPRDEQREALLSFAKLLRSAVAVLALGEIPNMMWRLIAPPRLGKSLMMAAVVALSKGRALVLAPTQDAVMQLHDEFKALMPEIPVGLYYGDEKNPSIHGLTFATYQIVVEHAKLGILPASMRNVQFVLCDEAHKVMTEIRMRVLHEIFPKECVRLAVTATEEYDDLKTLKRLFPTLVMEIKLEDAIQLGRLCEGDAYVYEIDADASEIQLDGTWRDDELLGKVMSQLPFLEATRRICYDLPESRGHGIQVCCTSKDQAYVTWVYLTRRRPKGTPPPALMLGTTKIGERNKSRDEFESGKIDIIVQVHVLLEAWNSPRCKVQVDLAPTVSFVRAKQKFFRPMTKNGAKEAKIYCLYPAGLTTVPVLPGDVLQGAIRFGTSADFWLDKDQTKRARAVEPKEIERRKLRVVQERVDQIKKVEVAGEIRHHARLGKRRLTLDDLDVVREIVGSEIPDPKNGVPSLTKFGALTFQTPYFAGSGQRLLRMLRIRPGKKRYARLLYQLFPGPATYELCQKAGVIVVDASTEYDVAIAMRPTESWAQYREAAANFEAWNGAFFGGETGDFEEEFDRRRNEVRGMQAYENVLSERQRFVIGQRKLEDEERTRTEIGNMMGLSHTRVGDIEKDAMRRLRQHGFPLEFYRDFYDRWFLEYHIND